MANKYDTDKQFIEQAKNLLITSEQKKGVIVRIANQVSSLNFSELSAKEKDLMNYLFSQVKEKETSKVIMPFDEIKKFTETNTHMSNSEFANYLETLNTKLANIQIKWKTEHQIATFVVFPTFIVDTNTNILQVRVNSDFINCFNYALYGGKNFTEFKLMDYVDIKGKHAKSLYQMLVQYKTLDNKYKRYDGEEYIEFLTNMGCLNDRQDVRTNRFIRPAVEELKHTPIFENLIFSYTKKGKTIVGIQFRWGEMPDDTLGNVIRSEDTKYLTEKERYKFEKLMKEDSKAREYYNSEKEHFSNLAILQKTTINRFWHTPKKYRDMNIEQRNRKEDKEFYDQRLKNYKETGDPNISKDDNIRIIDNENEQCENGWIAIYEEADKSFSYNIIREISKLDARNVAIDTIELNSRIHKETPKKLVKLLPNTPANLESLKKLG